MIINAQLLPVTVEMIQKHQRPFYLTGSRFFGGVSDISDWDFFALHSEELRSQLLDYGFEPNNNETYSSDTEIIEVLSKTCIDPGTGRLVKIDVQLLKALEKKAAVQEALKKTWGLRRSLPGDKTIQKCLWLAAYAGYDCAQKHE